MGSDQEKFAEDIFFQKLLIIMLQFLAITFLEMFLNYMDNMLTLYKIYYKIGNFSTSKLNLLCLHQIY